MMIHTNSRDFGGYGGYEDADAEADPDFEEFVGSARMLVQPYDHASSGKVVQLITQGKCCFGTDRVPRYLQNFDLTVCCVAFSASKDGQLHWLMPHVRDIIDGVQDATPFLCSLDLSLQSGASKKRERTLARVLKYSMRGFRPTAKLLKKFTVDVEDEFDCSIGELRLW
jgi:hypothetical protein